MSQPTAMDCATALRLLADYLDGELHDEPGHHLEHHLRTCRGCFSRAEFERRLKHEIGQLGREQVSSAFEARIRKLVGAFATPSDHPVND
jgi:anti-sigma factor (TIGR02949 family)